MTSALKLSFWILVCAAMSSEILMAAPFDKTGLVDLKNEGTIRGSCVTVGSRLQIATNSIYGQIMNRPAKGQDEQWKNQQDAKNVLDFGKSAEYRSKALQDGMSQYVPPSQMSDYFTTLTATMGKFDQTVAQDPWKGVDAWNTCGKLYGFLRQ
jgi:hypothetical protein